MVLVCHEHRFIYQKTLKTAGTSVEMALEPLCAAPGHKVVEGTPAVISEYGIIGARRGPQAADTTGWRSHLNAGRTRHLLGRALWRDYERIAVIRNPFDKAVSWFFWTQRNNPIRPGERIAAFRAFLRDKADQGYFGSDQDIDWKTTHIGQRPVINTWLKMENLRADLDMLAAGWDLAPGTLKLPETKRQVRASDALPVAAYYDQASIDILRRHQAWLFRAGGYSQSPEEAIKASALKVA